MVPDCAPKRPHQSPFPSAAHEGERPNSMRMGMQVQGLCTAPPRPGTLSGNPQRHQHRKQTSCWQRGKDRWEGSSFSQRNQKQAAWGSECQGDFYLSKVSPPLRGHRVTKHRAMINTWPRSAVTGHCLSYSPTSCVTLGKGFPSLDLCFSI